MPSSVPAPGPGPVPRSGPGRRSEDTGRDTAAGRNALTYVLLALTVVSGIVDAASYLGLGRVFTANMTGNVAVLGFAAAGAPGFSALHALVSLGGFVVGSVAGGRLGHWFEGRARRTWVRTALAGEALLLGASAVVAGTAGGSSQQIEYTLIALTAVAMGGRNALVGRLGVADLTTTVLTRTLTGLTAEPPFADIPKTLRRAGSVLSLLAGALLGAWLVVEHDLWLPLLAAAVIAAAMAVVVSVPE